MIYEMRTYDLKPRSLPEFIQRFGEAYEKRKRLSQLAAFWHTEIGPLNQVVHVWPYRKLDDRTRARKAALETGQWPPKADPDEPYNTDAQETKILLPAAFSPLR